MFPHTLEYNMLKLIKWTCQQLGRKQCIPQHLKIYQRILLPASKALMLSIFTVLAEEKLHRLPSSKHKILKKKIIIVITKRKKPDLQQKWIRKTYIYFSLGKAKRFTHSFLTMLSSRMKGPLEWHIIIVIRQHESIPQKLAAIITKSTNRIKLAFKINLIIWRCHNLLQLTPLIYYT